MSKVRVSRRAILPWLFVLTALVAVLALVWSLFFRPSSRGIQAQVIGVALPENSAGFMRASGPVPLTFPRDHGPHPDFQTEWWYYTGNLQTEQGRRFGYQLTFFRRAASPPDEFIQRSSAWATNQIYMAHFTLTDVSSKQFHYAERFERGAAGMAGAQSEPSYEVWLRDWKVEQVSPETYHLFAEQNGIAIDLQMIDRQGIVLQGDRGYSRKGPEPGNASIYYSQTHLESTGIVTVKGQRYSVSGLSWMDREISTSVLSAGQVGWDWFALHLDDGSDLMVFRLRRADGSTDPYSAGLYVAADGTYRALSRDDFEIVPRGIWRSPHSGAEYPAGFQVRVPSLGLEVELKPQVADQELNVSFIYWEGTMQVSGTRDGVSIAGFGYAELTGYAESFEGRF